MIITPIPAVDHERYQETGLPGFRNSILNKLEKIKFRGCSTRDDCSETKGNANVLFLPTCSDDPRPHAATFLKHTFQITL